MVAPVQRRFAALAALGALLCAGAAHADTVVLTNGRRVAVQSASRENGKVVCETAAGTLTFPESSVLRIETGGAAPQAARNPQADDVKIGLPAKDLSSDDAAVAQAVVHDGAIDLKALEDADSAASGGTPSDLARAIAAEAAASRFEFERNELGAALSHAERALSFAPEQVSLLLNVAYLHLRRGEYADAMTFLERAKKNAPDSVDAARLTGWADYGLNKLPEAVAEWKRAQQLAPDPQVAQALARAEHESEAETGYRESHSAHFEVRFYGSAATDLAFAMETVLEEDFSQISSVFNYQPDQPISVLLYTEEAFADITRAPAWAGAINDGKIRIPVQGLQTVTPQLAGVMKHELTHSFITAMTHGRAPIWLQEGLAQWMQGSRSGESATKLLAIYDAHQEPSLVVLSDSWLQLPADQATNAYAWSLAVIEALETGGPDDLDRVLTLLGSDVPPEAAFQQVFRMSYADLISGAANYLRQVYAPSPQAQR